MEKILLLGAACLNGGDYADAGTPVVVGSGDTQIDAVRAQELVGGLQAVEQVGPAQDPAKPEPRGK